ncbi:DivIVA domain-containing protein [Cellulomonas chengniuliangii]|uniref:DivIVA domain-containing protein n=1 Tax=Cellulomonas chengniuliangii TaxID=2968084 RepID=A0ABY5KZ88_9CELL|nr:DivIVA domain-containing protein [Cellulomonas chengniuliangii]MCC2307764.1 DivIVA domain-containing protein [Cellulomonas chengniuliangii]UUI75479.1 DivIVA domain-containing protein [Cellulomonas chengniuliangii]
MITAQQVRQISFARTRAAEAYDAAAVDHMLGRVAATLEALEQGRTVGPDGSRLLLPRDIRTAEPPAATDRGSGYSATQVDAFRSEVVATLEEYVRRHAGPRRKLSDTERPATPTTTPSAVSMPAAPAPTPSPSPTSLTSPTAISAATVAAAAGRTAPAPASTPLDLSSAPEGLGAYDVVLGLQSARAALFGAQRDRLLVRTPDGAIASVVGVETVADGIVVHVR